jgi:LmbE family N-acetylglucosaminyl deacetylase/glycosyltransferase involved in cell wall biosynthesis
MKLLTVTRETDADKRYGLGKSLLPLLTEIAHQGIEQHYLSQSELGDKSLAAQHRLQRFLCAILPKRSVSTQWSVWVAILLERLNMGRLAAKVAAREHYSHVHCHDPIIGAGYRLFRIFHRNKKARWGVTEHGFGCYTQAIIDENIAISSYLNRCMRRWERNTLLAADWVITPTELSLQQLVRDLSLTKIPQHWHAIVHPVPELKLYQQHNARQQLGWPEKSIVALSVGRLIPLKRFDLAIKALAMIPSLQLVILGEGDKTALLKLAEKLHCADRLTITVTDDISLYLHAADIYLSTSQTESFGMATLEALATATPVICTSVGGVPEVVKNAAHLIPKDNLMALFDALQMLFQPGARAKLSAKAFRHYQQWPSVENITDQHLALYRGNFNQQQSPFSCNEAIRPTDKSNDLLHTQSPIYPWIQSLSVCPLPKILPITPACKDLRVLVFAPHPDDETLGCGGTIAKLVNAGAAVKVVLASLGEQGYPQGVDPAQAGEIRKLEFIAAMSVLGVTDIVFYSEPDAHFKPSDALAKQLNDSLSSFSPHWLFLPSPLDCHRDHVSLSLSILEVWQRLDKKARVWLYEVWTPLPISHVIDISKEYPLKKQALQRYKLPLQCLDYLHFITGLNHYRGLAIGQDGACAEGFTELYFDQWGLQIEELVNLRQRQEHSYDRIY